MGRTKRKLGYSQTLMAQKVGVGQSVWARYELGNLKPTSGVLNAIKTLLSRSND